MMKTVVIPGLSDCSRIFSIAAFAASASSVIFRPGLARAAGLRQNRIGLPIHLLQQKIELLADFAAGVEQRRELRRMDLQPGQLFADIAAVGQDRGFLRQPLRIDLRAFEQILAAVRSAGSGKPPCAPARIASISAATRADAARCARAFPPAISAPSRARNCVQLVERGSSSASSSAASVPSGSSDPRRLRRTSRESAGPRSDPAAHRAHARPRLR